MIYSLIRMGRDNDFKSKSKMAYSNSHEYPSLKSQIRHFDESGENYNSWAYKKNVVEKGKVQGTPINTFLLKKNKNADDSSIGNSYLVVYNDEKLIRISTRAQDKSLEYAFVDLNGREFVRY